MRVKIAKSKKREEDFPFKSTKNLQKHTHKIETIDAFIKIAFDHYLLTLKKTPDGKDV